MMCQNCKIEFEPKKFNQNFCCPKCKAEFWNKEAAEGIQVLKCLKEHYPDLLPEIRSYANVHNVSLGEMICKLLDKTLSRDGQTFEDIYGQNGGKET